MITSKLLVGSKKIDRNAQMTSKNLRGNSLTHVTEAIDVEEVEKPMVNANFTGVTRRVLSNWKQTSYKSDYQILG